MNHILINTRSINPYNHHCTYNDIYTLMYYMYICVKVSVEKTILTLANNETKKYLKGDIHE